MKKLKALLILLLAVLLCAGCAFRPLTATAPVPAPVPAPCEAEEVAPPCGNPLNDPSRGHGGGGTGDPSNPIDNPIPCGPEPGDGDDDFPPIM